MKSRTRKLLSILLAAAMVLSMNTFAFAEPEDNSAPTEIADIISPPQPIPPIPDYEWKDGMKIPSSYTQIKEFDDSNLLSVEKTKVDVTGDAVKITGISINDLLALRETSKGKAVIETILSGGKPEEDTYLVNKKEIQVSQNMGEYDEIKGLRGPVPAYYDVVALDGGNYLFLRYSLNGADLGWVSGVQDPIPVIPYTGQKTDFRKNGAKDNKSKRNAIVVAAALVKFADGTLEKIPGVSVTGTKVDKNGKDASVSGETITQKASRKSLGLEFKDAEFDEYVKAGNAKDIPTFTIKAKAADAAKSSGKAIKTALKAKKYQFAISQKVMYVGEPGGSSYTTKNGTLSFNDAEGEDKETFYIGGVDKQVLDFSDDYDLDWDGDYNDEGTICVSKFNGKKANVTTCGCVTEGKHNILKLKAGKDYELKTDGKLGSGTVAYIDEFKGNFMYSNNSSLSKYGYKYAFRQSPDEKLKKKYLRGGVFKAEGDGFVHSVD